MIQGKRIWDVTRIPDREKTRMEFPDLARFKGDWYCAFREGEIHGSHPSGRGRVIRSPDGENWNSVALMEWDGADVRELRLSVTAEGQLMVNTSINFVSQEPRADGYYYQLDRRGTPEDDAEAHVARQSVTWLSADGDTWSSAYACPSGVNTWRWDVTWHNGMGYSVGYCGKDTNGTLYRTRDGQSWRVLLADLFPDGGGNEVSVAFDLHDAALGLLRGGRTPAMIGIGKAPFYLDWEWKGLRIDWNGDGDIRPSEEVLRAPFGGPKIIRLDDGRILAAGRVLGPGYDDGRITLFWVDPEQAVLTRFAAFDGTSYPGVAEHDGLLWVSYTSSDASGVFLANVGVPGQ